MPNPKYLTELKTRTERALNADPPDGLTAFSVAWALWEAVRRRMLVLACKREGWTVDQAREVLMGERIDNTRFTQLFSVITGGTAWEDSLPLAAQKLWPLILEAVDLRKRIIHGTSRIGEENLQRTAWNVLRFVNRLHEHPMGDPLKRLPDKTKKSRSDQSLRDQINAWQ